MTIQGHHRLNAIAELEATRRDVETAIELQESINYKDEDSLAVSLCNHLGLNWSHAREIAELAWMELYAEKEGD